MFKHSNLSRLFLLLRIWWLERTQAILEDQQARVQVALQENDLALNLHYCALRRSLPPINQQLSLDLNHD